MFFSYYFCLIILLVVWMTTSSAFQTISTCNHCLHSCSFHDFDLNLDFVKKKNKRDNYSDLMKMLLTWFVSHSHWQQANYLNNQYRLMSLENEEMRTMSEQITLLLMFNNHLQFRTQTCLPPSFFSRWWNHQFRLISSPYSIQHQWESFFFSHTFILTVCISVQLGTCVFTWMIIHCLNTVEW